MEHGETPGLLRKDSGPVVGIFPRKRIDKRKVDNSQKIKGVQRNKSVGRLFGFFSSKTKEKAWIVKKKDEDTRLWISNLKFLFLNLPKIIFLKIMHGFEK